MSDKYEPRRILLALAALLLPAATCGVAPAIQELVGRVNLLETRAARFERFVAEAQLPSLLVDDHDFVVGSVLEYNDMFVYKSINGANYDFGSPYSLPDANALATVQLRVPGRAPVILEAHRDALLTPTRGAYEVFFFETPDCTGAPLQPVNYGDEEKATVFSQSYIGPPGDMLYALSPGVSARYVLTRSRMYTRGVVRETQSPCSQTNYTVWVLPFEPVAWLGQYTPPFRIVEQREFFNF